MIGLALGVKVYLCTTPADMRRGFDGLSGMAESLMKQNPLSGHLFVFRNRNRDKLKILGIRTAWRSGTSGLSKARFSSPPMARIRIRLLRELKSPTANCLCCWAASTFAPRADASDTNFQKIQSKYVLS